MDVPFYICAGIGIAAAFSVILQRRAVLSVLSLMVVLITCAAMYAMLGAHFLAVLQILVYAGAVMVLFVFVVMLLDPEILPEEVRPQSILERLWIFILTLGVSTIFAMLVWVFAHRYVPYRQMGADNTEKVSLLLFSEHIAAFEATSLILIAAIVGALTLSKRHRKAKG